MVLATVAWAIGEVMMRRDPARDRFARALWTAGIILALIHVALAFQFVYGWDHEAAIAATAQQAADRFGWGWRGGIYVNYAFLTLWCADVGWWWIAPDSHRSRSPRLEALRRAAFLFMFINGAVIFAAGIGRLVGVAAVAVVVVASLLRRGVAT
jgi:hypothetical protein